MIGVELVTDRRTNEPAAAAAGSVRRHCLERGVLIGVGGNHGNVLRVQLPLVVEDAQLERVMGVVADGMEAAAGR